MIKTKKTVALNLMSGSVSTIVSNVLQFVSIPILLTYFGPEKYGLLILILAVVSILQVSNFGLDLATSFVVAKKEDPAEKNVIVQWSLKRLLVLSLALSAVFVVLATTFPSYIDLLGRIPSDLRSQTETALLIMGVVSLATIPSSVFSFAAYQMQFIENGISTLAALLNLVALLLVVVMKADILLYVSLLAVARLLTVLFRFTLFARVTGFRASRKGIHSGLPKVEQVLLIKTAIIYFTNALSLVCLANIDTYFISNLFGFAEVSQYSITSKLFFLYQTVFFLFMNSIFSHISLNSGRQNWAWLNLVLRLTKLFFIALGGFFAVISINFLPLFIHIWTGGDGFAGFGVVVWLSIYTVFLGLNVVDVNYTTALNSTKVVRFVPGITWVTAIIKIVSILALYKLLSVSAVAVGTLVSFVAVSVWLYPILVRRSSGNEISVYASEHGAALLVCCGMIGLSLVSHYFRPGLLEGSILVLLYLVLQFAVARKGIIEVFDLLRFRRSA